MFLGTKRVVALLQYHFPLIFVTDRGQATAGSLSGSDQTMGWLPSLVQAHPWRCKNLCNLGEVVEMGGKYCTPHDTTPSSYGVNRRGFEISTPDQKANIYCAGIAIKIFEYIFTVILASIYLLPTNLLLHRDLSSTQSRVLVID